MSDQPYCGAILNCALPMGHEGRHERADGVRWGWPKTGGLRLLWHRLRRHQAYRNGSGWACNTCDKDWLR